MSEYPHNGTDEVECTECGHYGTGSVPGCSCPGCDDLNED